MVKAEFIRARVNEELKSSTETLFSRLGLTMTEAITLFLVQCDLRQGLPFDVRLPNAETMQALEDARNDTNLTSHENAEALFESWG